MTLAFPLEKNVPLPERPRTNREGVRAAAEVAEVSDSFLIPEEAGMSQSYVVSLAGKLNQMLAPKRFYGAREGNGWRIWRKS